LAAPQAAAARLTMGMPRGVDLNLEKFNLSSHVQHGSWAGTVEAPAGAALVPLDYKAFWLDLEQGEFLAKEDVEILTKVFNPKLSDRRGDGDKFVPPPTSLTYMQKLKTLIKEEACIMEKRKGAFLSTNFDKDNCGPLFPASWTPTFGLGRADPADGTCPPASSLIARPDLMAEDHMLQEVLASTPPTFQKSTEEGTEFLIFNIGNLEVRATRALDGEMKVGAVFSEGGAEMKAAFRNPLPTDDERMVVHAAEFVERGQSGTVHYFVVMDLEDGNVMVGERFASGKEAWTENPEHLAARISAAKLMRKADIADEPIAVADLCTAATENRDKGPNSKLYARMIYTLAVDTA